MDQIESLKQEFEITGDAQEISGGRGSTISIGEYILKPLDTTSEEANWVMDLYEAINKVCENESFEIARPKRNRSGNWISNGWICFYKSKGKEDRAQLLEKLEISNELHKLLENYPKPDFLDLRNNRSSIADNIAWQSSDAQISYKPLKEVFNKLQTISPKINLPSQIIHGDLGGNILFSESSKPVVIDFSPYFRPKAFANAIMVVDDLVWGSKDFKLLEELRVIDPDTFNLLPKAELKRLLELDGFLKESNSFDIEKEMGSHNEFLVKLYDIFQ
jgi:hypothetical protein